MQEMITANRLADGLVVFLDADGRWSEDFHRGVVLSDAAAKADAVARAQASAAANEVVEPYPIELELRAGHLAPKALREWIRASGPTVRADLGKQAQGLAPTVAQRG
jgi:sulfite reductase (NADPH) hemoprotein beta-component